MEPLEPAQAAPLATVCWARLRQYSLRKKAAVAVVIVTAGPVVILPLVVLSTVALALAFPAALYLASFAFTEKLMSSLLGQRESDGGDEKDDKEDLPEDSTEIPVE